MHAVKMKKKMCEKKWNVKKWKNVEMKHGYSYENLNVIWIKTNREEKR